MPNLTTVFGSNKVNSFIYEWADSNSISTLTPNTGMPGVSVAGISYGHSAGGTGINLETRNEVKEDFSFTMGKHSFKTGVDFDFVHDSQGVATPSGGTYSYSSNTTLDAVDGCGSKAAGGSNDSAFCAWILDLYGVNAGGTFKKGQLWNTYSQAVDGVACCFPQAFDSEYPNTDYAAYFQDTWKARPNLTVNAGLRYDLQDFTDLPNSISALLAAGKLPRYCDHIGHGFADL